MVNDTSRWTGFSERQLKIYFAWMSDRNDKTMVQTMVRHIQAAKGRQHSSSNERFGLNYVQNHNIEIIEFC